MKIGKVTGSHYDGSQKAEFIEDCITQGAVAVSFAFPEGNPFDELTEEQMKAISSSELKERFEDHGISEGKAKNAADQITRFRDWETAMPLMLYRGNNTVARLGRLSGEYRFDQNGFFANKYDGYPHVRDVEWAEVPQEFPRSELSPSLSNWVKNPQTVLDHDVEPRSATADFLSIAWGLGFAMGELEPSQRRVLR